MKKSYVSINCFLYIVLNFVKDKDFNSGEIEFYIFKP